MHDHFGVRQPRVESAEPGLEPQPGHLPGAGIGYSEAMPGWMP